MGLILIQCLCQVQMLQRLCNGETRCLLPHVVTPSQPIIPKQIKTRTTIKNGETRAIPTYRNGCKNSEKILWMPEFLNAETHTPVLLMNHLLEPTTARSADLGKHSVYTHFTKDRNCEICQRTNITRAPCRRRNGGVVLRAEKFGDLITADHKVLSESCESRNNHRCAVVVQDLATQWIQSCPCKTKTSQETHRSLQKFLEPKRKPKVIYTDNFVNLAKPVKIFPGIIVRRHHTDRKQMGLL